MRLIFVTTNRHKAEEVAKILEPYGIKVTQKAKDYPEVHELGVEGIARKAAKDLAEELGEAVCVEDTGLFFDAYPGFPGPLPKFVLQTLGFDGIMKLLENKEREAEWRCAVGYCEPGGDPEVFVGTLEGRIAESVDTSNPDPMGYDPIFIAEGHDSQLSSMTTEEKNRISHRAEAFRKLGRELAD